MAICAERQWLYMRSGDGVGHVGGHVGGQHGGFSSMQPPPPRHGATPEALEDRRPLTSDQRPHSVHEVLPPTA
eukprot:2153459-Rhodomonas_salina.1